MRRMTQAAIVALVLGWSLPTLAEQAINSPAGGRTTSRPYEMVRALQLLQDQIAYGSTTAHVAQRALLAHIDQSFSQMDDSEWQDRKNLRAAVLFVLSGGKPDILKKLSALPSLMPEDARLVRGALDYVEGREEEARKSLEGLDLDTLPPMLAGQIALVQSALVVGTSPVKSSELLDRVRLLMPGTLLEEAALRRQVLVVGQKGDLNKFQLLVRQYLSRFRNSIYAGNFRQRLAATVARLDLNRDQAHFSQLVSILNDLEPPGRLELYLTVARSALDRGQKETAIRAAEKAAELATKDRQSALRAQLYKGAAQIVTAEGFEAGISRLRTIDKAELPASDVQLLDSALAIATQIRNSPSIEVNRVAPASNDSKVPSTAEMERPLPSISRAREALSLVDQLLKGNQ